MKFIKYTLIAISLIISLLLLSFIVAMIIFDYKIENARKLDVKEATTLYGDVVKFKNKIQNKNDVFITSTDSEYQFLPESIKELNPVWVQIGNDYVIITRYEIFVDVSGIYISLIDSDPHPDWQPKEIIPHVYSFRNPG